MRTLEQPSFLSRLGAGLICATLLFVGPAVAIAGPPPRVGGDGGSGPEQEACAGRSVGDACTMPNRQLGTCTQGTCNRLDYSQGSPPKAIEEACVVCQQGQGGQAGQSGGQTSHGDMPALGTNGAPPDDTGASEGGAKGKEPPESASRCRVHDDLDPLASVALAGLLLLAYRRRRA